MLGAGITTKILTKVAPLGRDPSYAAHILPAIFLTAFGFAMGFVPLPLTAVDGVRAEESGIASALLNASQQIGVALALALLSTIAITATDARLPRALDALHEGREARDPVLIEAASDALIHGYGSGLATGAVAIAVAALLAAVLITTRRPTGGVRPGLH